MDILFEDNHLLVLNKPSGLLTQPSGTSQPSLEEEAKLYLKNKFQKTGNVFLHAVHRLDRAVSGIVVFARTSKALTRLNQMMREHRLVKRYRALVHGRVLSDQILEHYLIHDDFQAKVVPASTPGAKLCRLDLHVVKTSPTESLLEIQLQTGRYHQIRAQLSAIGHCIVGDQKYGSPVALPGGGIALEHHYFEFTHPVSQERIAISLPASDNNGF